jgi:phosphodiesterase/alkaline phosphatase D-like protein
MRLVFMIVVFLLTYVNSKGFRVSFGSCNDLRWAQPFWPFIRSQAPDVFVWLGDIVYPQPWRIFSASLDDIQDSFSRQRLHPEYNRLTKEIPIIGVWDDVDYGTNDGDKTFHTGRQASKYLWDFLEEPIDSPRRAQSGVWSSHTYTTNGRTIRVILLDNRSHRDVTGPIPGVWHKRFSDPQDMLGEEQWAWLERELTDTRTDITIIGLDLRLFSSHVDYFPLKYPPKVLCFVFVFFHTRYPYISSFFRYSLTRVLSQNITQLHYIDLRIFDTTLTCAYYAVTLHLLAHIT